MKKIIIFGATELGKKVKRCLKREEAEFVAFCDNDINKINKEFDGEKVLLPDDIIKFDFDYIIIAVNKYLSISYKNILYQFDKLNISKDKIIEFIDNEEFDFDSESKYIDMNKLKCIELEAKIEFKDIYINNLKYELLDPRNKEKIEFPKMKSRQETLEEILKNKSSICRYGDGEFALIYNDERCRFQDADNKLIKRLMQILKSDEPNIIIGISDFFGQLNDLLESGKRMARRFFKQYSRNKIYDLLNMEKQYYNAYAFRPYCFINEKNPQKSFDLIKQIWQDRDIVIIEGEYTRMGMGNDLFDNAKSIKRIITLNKNAFSKYDDILNEALKLSKDKLILIALGPTATVLAYDLAVAGYQAIDLGHLDIEYEHFLRKANSLIKIDNKYTNDVLEDNFIKTNNLNSSFEKYDNQIINKIL